MDHAQLLLLQISQFLPDIDMLTWVQDAIKRRVCKEIVVKGGRQNYNSYTYTYTFSFSANASAVPELLFRFLYYRVFPIVSNTRCSIDIGCTGATDAQAFGFVAFFVLFCDAVFVDDFAA